MILKFYVTLFFQLYLYNNSLVNLEFHMLDWSSLKKFNIKDNSFECTCDLYNISKGLNSVISRNKDGPDCLDLMDGRSRQIYELEEDVCQFEVSEKKNMPFRNFVAIFINIIYPLLIYFN